MILALPNYISYRNKLTGAKVLKCRNLSCFIVRNVYYDYQYIHHEMQNHNCLTNL